MSPYCRWTVISTVPLTYRTHFQQITMLLLIFYLLVHILFSITRWSATGKPPIKTEKIIPRAAQIAIHRSQRRSQCITQIDFFFFKHITINCCPTLIFNLANSDPYLYSHLVSVIFIWKIQLVRTFNISIEFFCSLWIQILATLLKEATKSQQKGNLFDVRIMM